MKRMEFFTLLNTATLTRQAAVSDEGLTKVRVTFPYADRSEVLVDVYWANHLCLSAQIVENGSEWVVKGYDVNNYGDVAEMYRSYVLSYFGIETV